MSEVANENAKSELVRKIEGILLGLKITLGFLLIVFSIPNYSTARVIPKFQQIFTDALPGKPLGALTNELLHYQAFLVLLTLFWPLAGLLNLYLGKRVRTWVIVSNILLILIGLQTALTWYGLFTPMVDIGPNMSDAAGK